MARRRSGLDGFRAQGVRRTGAIHIPDAQIREVAQALMVNMGVNRYGIIRYGDDARTTTTIRMADGRSLDARVFLRMDSSVKDLRGISGFTRVSRMTVEGGQIQIRDVDISIHLKSASGRDVESLAHDIRSVLAHEMTHVADPTLHAQSEDQMRAYIRGEVADPKADFITYLNSKTEMTARIQQIARDLLSEGAASAIKEGHFRPEVVLEWSPTWTYIEGYLTHENRQRVFRAVGHILDGIKSSRFSLDQSGSVFGLDGIDIEIGAEVNLPLDKLVVNHNSLLEAYSDVARGKGSRTTGLIEVWVTEQGEFLLIDGHHRLVQYLLSGHRSIRVMIAGSGYSDYWAIPKPNERALLDSKLKYGGIENLTDKRGIRDALRALRLAQK